MKRPLIGCMMFGVTTPCVLRAAKYFEGRGYDVLINHAVGSGGRSLEELIRDGFVVGRFGYNNPTRSRIISLEGA